jgi:exodeoxyribonuclease V beta subunit
MATLTRFDVCGPLPTGVSVLEASAGTGKTFTIAALTARYVADGIPLERLLVVTFTRMATGELRERVRDRLISAEHGLGLVAAGIAPPEDDDVLVVLADAPPNERDSRRRRLAQAIADFDAATISTTHGFCQHVLHGLGVAGDIEEDLTFVEDARDLLDDIVDDLYVRRFHRQGTPLFGRAEALRIARAAVSNLAAPIAVPAWPNEARAMRCRFARAVRVELERRKRLAKILTYDDLLTRLRDTLCDPDRGPAACRRLRERYRVALIDEFQDTDPVQWDIVRSAFSGEGCTLVLIGDPKQAIYAFRGADVYAYLDARRVATRRETLAVNWRSDQALLDAYDALLSGTRLGHPEIDYQRVSAAAAHQQSGLRGAPDPAPLRVRIVHRDDGLVGLTDQTGAARRPDAERHVAADLAADVVRLLSSNAEVVFRSGDGGEQRTETIGPGHLAVLAPTHRHAAMIRDELDARGVPAVINGAGSVFAAAAAAHWLTLLEALERPTSPTRVRTAAITPFIGWSANDLAAADEPAIEELHSHLHRWARLLRQRGVASLIETVTRRQELPRRLLAASDGERQLTDLRHVGQLLHAEATAEQLGVTALAAWLRARIRYATRETGAEERSRRLETDAEAVQVLTIHRSKGLEFPVVYLPYLWEPTWFPDDDPAVYHDADAAFTRTIDVTMDGPDFLRHQHLHRVEGRGETLRLTYVGLTRARHQAVLWWASSYGSSQSPLGRLLFARDSDGNIAAIPPRRVHHEDRVADRLRELCPVSDRLSIERTTRPPGIAWHAAAPAAPVLDVARFDRTLDLRWQRTSYTAITSAAHEPAVASEPEAPGVTDEPPAPAAVPASVDDAGDHALRAVNAPSRQGPAVGHASRRPRRHPRARRLRERRLHLP